MARRGFKGRAIGLAAILAMGGSVFQLGGCDPAVRTELLGGLEMTTNALTDTVVTAFFISLQDDESDDGVMLTTTTQ